MIAGTRLFLVSTISPTRKNTARIWCCLRMSRTLGVCVGFGPSSNVNRTSGSPEAELPAAGVGQLRAVAVEASASTAAIRRRRTTDPVTRGRALSFFLTTVPGQR